jgi:DNA-binding MarR family transcriptional regulator
LNLLRAGDEVYKKVETFFTEHGMTPGRFTVLMLLFDKIAGVSMPRTPAELAEKAGVARATMTGLVDTAERDGLVTRKHDSSDRRMMLIHLTPKGQAILEEMLPGYFRQMALQMEALSESERATLVRILTKMAGPKAQLTTEARPNLTVGAA